MYTQNKYIKIDFLNVFKERDLQRNGCLPVHLATSEPPAFVAFCQVLNTVTLQRVPKLKGPQWIRTSMAPSFAEQGSHQVLSLCNVQMAIIDNPAMISSKSIYSILFYNIC